jgi:hypothetical protein
MQTSRNEQTAQELAEDMLARMKAGNVRIEREDVLAFLDPDDWDVQNITQVAGARAAAVADRRPTEAEAEGALEAIMLRLCVFTASRLLMDMAAKASA